MTVESHVLDFLVSAVLVFVNGNKTGFHPLCELKKPANAVQKTYDSSHAASQILTIIVTL